jgi:hypothetical protein
MFDRFGGVDALCAAWKEQFDTARRERPGSPALLRMYTAVIELAATCASGQRCDLSRVSDVDFEQEMTELLACYV